MSDLNNIFLHWLNYILLCFKVHFFHVLINILQDM